MKEAIVYTGDFRRMREDIQEASLSFQGVVPIFAELLGA